MAGLGFRSGTVVLFFDDGMPPRHPPLELSPVAKDEPRRAVTALAFGRAGDRSVIVTRGADGTVAGVVAITLSG